MSVPMTAGERLKIISYFDQGWDENEISSRLNRVRRDGYLSNKNLPQLTPQAVMDWLYHFGQGQKSA